MFLTSTRTLRTLESQRQRRIAALTSMGNAWWTGVPTTLLRKTTLVPASANHLPVHTLAFAIPKDATFSGKARPHRDVRIDLGDVVKMVIPGYKPKSYSISELRDDEFDVTFKVYPNGRASGFLDRLAIGDTINSFGMQKGVVRNPGKYVGIVAFGVGITEALPVAEAELKKDDAEHVRLLWASRTMDDTFWHEKIEQIEKAHAERFSMVHILSRQARLGSLKGRIDSTVLGEVFHPASNEDARFLTVGTKEMISMADTMLTQAGFPMPQHALLPKS